MNIKYLFFFCIFLSCNSNDIDSSLSGNNNESTISDGLELADHRAFLTPIAYSGNLGGLSGADSICQTHAVSAGLTRTYKALLSSSFEDARDRIISTGAVYIFTSPTNKLKVIDNLDDIFNLGLVGDLQNSISYDVNYLSSLNDIYTGTESSGILSDNCNDWSSDSVDEAIIGDASALNSEVFDMDTAECDELLQFICISE